MLRCAVALLLALAGVCAQAQVARLFPPTALRGELTGSAPPDVLINGRAARLAPGARIRNEENRLDVIGTLQGRKATVHYTTDAGGQLLEIWLLTPSERANEPWPATTEQAQAWRFEPISQKWTRP